MLENKKRKKKSHVPARMNMLFFIVFLLFSLLILRLGVVQIVNGEDAKRELEKTEDINVNTSVPRGIIFDRYYNPIVENEPQKAITYTAPKGAKQEETLEIARELAKIIDQDTKKITYRDKVDYWLMLHPDEGDAKITEAEKEKYKGKDAELDKLKRERVTDAELESLTEDELEVLAIYREFTSGYALVPQIVKNENVTMEEFAEVSEHLSKLPGVDTTIDWNRSYVYENTLRSILGNLTTGLPAENLQYYLSRGYSRNDRVGKSYIELQYEDVLRGQKEKVKNITRSGEIIGTKLVHEGKQGNNLVLTIDMELQQEIDKIIEEEILSAKGQYGARLLDRAFVTLMDPFTGEVLAMSGKQYRYNEEEKKYEFSDFAAGNMTTAYVPGSAIKGATVMSGYMAGVLNVGGSQYDEPLIIKGTGTFSSHFNRGGNNQSITDYMALVRSSNVFMYKTAIQIGDGRYQRGMPLIIDKAKAFNQMRYYFNQFGLGVKTGIDLPGEQTGFIGSVASAAAGNALHFSIGQYDTYTPLQLAQYVSTIANGGYRMQPQIVKEIREPGDGNGEPGAIVREMKPNVLNRLDATDRQIEQVQKGFYGVFHDAQGTGRSFFSNKPYEPAGKTGTAETRDQATDVWNLTLVGYAPYKNPEVAMSVVVPSAYVDGASDNRINLKIGERVMDAYFDIKAKRANIGGSEKTEE
ncbi:penicillin-binding protein 2 [Bacillus sp. FJAT-50079]|nr:penicillin-binding protein 2 [Bacillus sp. FJAT-50079]